MTQRGSRLTFEVRARDSSGKKVKSAVLLNGESVAPTWDDSEKTSYTLVFETEGENTVTVSATPNGKTVSKTYRINYKKAKKGEVIGHAVWSVEAFTLGCGYLVAPVSVPVYEGETAADALLRLLKNNGYNAYYGGSASASFYLAYIADGDKTSKRFNGYTRGESPQNPKKLNLRVNIPDLLVPHLEKTMTYFDSDDYAENWEGFLGEFVVTNGSGWMYSVNNNFPNVGFADTYLSDGDVVRVRFTLGYGADIGGFGAVGTEIPDVENQPSGAYFATANGDKLTVAVARALASKYKDRENVASALAAAEKTLEKLNASASEISAAEKTLEKALASPTATSESTTAEGSSAAPTDMSEETSAVPSESTAATETASVTNTGDETSSASSETGETEQSGLATPVIIAVACIFVVALAVCFGVIFSSKKRNAEKSEKNDEK